MEEQMSTKDCQAPLIDAVRPVLVSGVVATRNIVTLPLYPLFNESAHWANSIYK